jgi:hypothetical protein
MNQDWLNDTLENAIEVLAARSVVSRRVGGLVKQAQPEWFNSLQGGLKDLLTKAKLQDLVGEKGMNVLSRPELAAALAGAGIGGIGGALTDEDSRGRGALRGMLAGGVAGGGLMGALGLLGSKEFVRPVSGTEVDTPPDTPAAPASGIISKTRRKLTGEPEPSIPPGAWGTGPAREAIRHPKPPAWVSAGTGIAGDVVSAVPEHLPFTSAGAAIGAMTKVPSWWNARRDALAKTLGDLRVDENTPLRTRAQIWAGQRLGQRQPTDQLGAALRAELLGKPFTPADIKTSIPPGLLRDWRLRGYPKATEARRIGLGRRMIYGMIPGLITDYVRYKMMEGARQ